MGEAAAQQVIKIKDVWYLETLTGYEGPFESLEEANNYLRLRKRADAARIEFAGLAFTPP